LFSSFQSLLSISETCFIEDSLRGYQRNEAHIMGVGRWAGEKDSLDFEIWHFLLPF